MKKLILLTLPLCAVCLFSQNLNGQQRSAPGKILRGTGKATVIVVSSAAKATWVTTKFTATHMAAPTAKFILLRAAPRSTVFTLKLAGKIAEKAVPAVGKLGLAYLRSRLPI